MRMASRSSVVAFACEVILMAKSPKRKTSSGVSAAPDPSSRRSVGGAHVPGERDRVRHRPPCLRAVPGPWPRGWTCALEGATLREDLDDNATLYGKKLENSKIVTKGVRPPKAAAKLLELLNRYSAKERKN
jgi:Las17-binding protein actin regulator